MTLGFVSASSKKCFVFGILSLFPKFLERFAVYVIQLPILSESIMIPIILLISYGYLRLKRWGYWLIKRQISKI